MNSKNVTFVRDCTKPLDKSEKKWRMSIKYTDGKACFFGGIKLTMLDYYQVEKLLSSPVLESAYVVEVNQEDLDENEFCPFCNTTPCSGACL